MVGDPGPLMGGPPSIAGPRQGEPTGCIAGTIIAGIAGPKGGDPTAPACRWCDGGGATYGDRAIPPYPMPANLTGMECRGSCGGPQHAPE
mmetsp:Transcript_61612/g.142019  ORF Transcript_61612/g.142019 Transcript_61612/m.142019 type:complete len:90 (+) Transcript_61612:827-1096(+)